MVRDDNGEIYTVRYEAVNAMLLNEFLKEHRKVENLEGKARTQDATIVQLKTQIQVLTSGLQKVTDQLTLSRTALKLAYNQQ